MGSQVHAQGKLPLIADVASEVPIARIDLVCQGQDVQSIEPRQHKVVWETQVEISSPSWYYIRVLCQNGEMGWSSPIWVTPD